MPTKDLLGPYQFERGQPSRQSILLDARLIVRNHIGDVAFHRHHGKAVPARKRGKFRATNTASHVSPNAPTPHRRGAAAQRARLVEKRRDAHEIFYGLGADPWRRRAANQLRRGRSEGAASSQWPAGLTDLEIQVARLVQQGSRNGDIAVTLSIV
jgi:hypothetical protein